MRTAVPLILVVLLSLIVVANATEPGRPPAKLGERCGGHPGPPCDDGLMCDITTCAKDVDGICVARPEVCTQNYTPVCGCDHKTYSNDCARRMANVSRARTGACK